ncbi:MAG: spore coat U domain-containing protein [Eikenella sp.]|nr:spore coat U domain-containing protein [Eikenella sp.]
MKLWTPVLTAAALLAAAPALAETANGEFKTTILINKSCTVTTHSGSHDSPAGADIDFGAHDAQNNTEKVSGQSKEAQESTTALTVKCSQGTSFSIGLKPASGTGNDGTGEMTHTDGTDKIAYSLHKDASHNQPWGNEAGNWLSLTGQGFAPGVNRNNTFTVYGKVDAGQLDKPAGRYNDTVTVTVTY